MPMRLHYLVLYLYVHFCTRAHFLSLMSCCTASCESYCARITQMILYCVPPLIFTSCITVLFHPSSAQVWGHLHKLQRNEYCTVFHPSFVQVRPHLHKLQTNEYCTMFHPSFVQVWPHLHKLHSKWLLYCVPPLICTSSTSSAQVMYCISELHHSSEQLNIVPLPSPVCKVTNAGVPLDCVSFWILPYWVSRYLQVFCSIL